MPGWVISLMIATGALFLVLLTTQCVLIYKLVKYRLRQGTFFYVPAFKTGLLFTNGKFVRTLSPGQHRRNDIDTIVIVETRPMTILTRKEGEDLLLRDGTVVKVRAIFKYRIVDPVIAVTQARSYEYDLAVAIQIALKQAASTLTYGEFAARADSVAGDLEARVRPQAQGMGLELLKIDLLAPVSVADGIVKELRVSAPEPGDDDDIDYRGDAPRGAAT